MLRPTMSPLNSVSIKRLMLMSQLILMLMLMLASQVRSNTDVQ